MEGVLLLFILLFWFLPAIATGVIASNRGRSGAGWFLLGVFLGWIALVIVLVLPTPTDPMPVNVLPSGGDPRQPCPRCGESIPLAARVCRFCGQELSPAD